MIFTFETIWEKESQPPPYKANRPTAVNFNNAVLASAIGTPISHSKVPATSLECFSALRQHCHTEGRGEGVSKKKSSLPAQSILMIMNQRRLDPELSDLSAATAEITLLLR
eukprot:4023576-Pleurochrysis_carterae.AAC.2